MLSSEEMTCQLRCQKPVFHRQGKRPKALFIPGMASQQYHAFDELQAFTPPPSFDWRTKVCEQSLARLRHDSDDRDLPSHGERMADITLTITLPDSQAEALATLIASLGDEQFEDAYQHWLNHWKATEAYSPAVEMNTTDLMAAAVGKLHAALAAAGVDVLSRLSPR